jgi:TonB family protein
MCRIVFIALFSIASAGAQSIPEVRNVFELWSEGLPTGRPCRPPTEVKVYQVGDGVTAPAVISKAKPVFTDEARAAKREGTVLLSGVIDPEGLACGDWVVGRSMGLDMDRNAVASIAKWRFKPGSKDGKPISVTVHIEVNFRLTEKP